MIATKGVNVLNSIPHNTSGLSPCSHEETDTRMFVHAAEAVTCGMTKIIELTVDTDVLVLAVSLVQTLNEMAGQAIELWIAFGTGTNLRYIAAHETSDELSASAAALPAFHAFTRMRHGLRF